MTPIHLYAQHSNDLLVESLIICGVDVNAIEIVSYSV